MEHSELLARIPLFESLDSAELEALTSRLTEHRLDAGTVVFRQGEDGSTLYLIEEGAVDITYGEGNASVVLATLFPGHYFGELSLLDNGPRSATATATKPSVLLELRREDFVDFIEKHPAATTRIIAEIGERMRQTNELMSRQVSKNVVEEQEEALTFGQRVADRVATFGGSWSFIGLFSSAMATWMVLNLAHTANFDPYPFILLNLVLSTLAALQAPVIMMSQNRQAVKDKLLAQNDYQVNLKSEVGIEKLLKGQTELLARLTFIERHVGLGRSQRPEANSVSSRA
jgi:uncharacterized membrane protein